MGRRDDARGRAAQRIRRSPCGRAPAAAGSADDVARLSFSGLFFFGLTEPHAGTPAVFVNEVDTGALESTSNHVEGRAPWPCRSRLQLVNCQLAYTGLRRKLLLAPTEKTARGSALRWRNHRP